MAYEYDRFEREDTGGSFLMGLLAGTVLGAGLGMLFAPKAGSELRNQISEQAGRIRNTANDTYHQASGRVSQIVDKGKEAYERARGSSRDMGTSNLGTGTTGASGAGTGSGTSNPSYSTPGSTNRI